MKQQHLLILGAGMAGLSVVHALKHMGPITDDLAITLVDPDFIHRLGFTLPWVMRGWRDVDDTAIHTTRRALEGISTIAGSADHIDPATRTVTLADKSTLTYDCLVVATGARNDLAAVKGLQSAVDTGVAVHYYDPDAAAAAHTALQQVSAGKIMFLVTATPYRCPVAPYEGALLAADLLRERDIRDKTTIDVYSPEPSPMPSAGPYAGRELLGILTDNDIGFYGGHHVLHVDANTRTATFEGSAVVEFDLLVFVPPHSPTLSLNGSGWIPIDVDTMQTQYPGVFAVGDTTTVTSPSGQPLPKAAIFAKNGGWSAATNALKYLGRDISPRPLSGHGYCFIDTGSHASAQGMGDFFALPHPNIHLAGPSVELHLSKQYEETNWRNLWELP